MSSKDLAETIFRAEKIADLVRQIDNIDFCISEENPEKIYIRNGEGKVDKEKPIIDIGDLEIPEEMQQSIGIERICMILNDALEKAKFNILKETQISVFNKLDFEEPESDPDDDEFIPVRS